MGFVSLLVIVLSIYFDIDVTKKKLLSSINKTFEQVGLGILDAENKKTKPCRGEYSRLKFKFDESICNTLTT